MLRDVLMPDEVADYGGPPQGRGYGEKNDGSNGGAGRVDDIWGRSDGSSGGGGGQSFGGGALFGGQQQQQNVPSVSPSGGGGMPTPAAAFERRLAENPIVPCEFLLLVLEISYEPTGTKSILVLMTRFASLVSFH